MKYCGTITTSIITTDAITFDRLILRQRSIYVRYLRLPRFLQRPAPWRTASPHDGSRDDDLWLIARRGHKVVAAVKALFKTTGRTEAQVIDREHDAVIESVTIVMLYRAAL